MRSFAVIAGFAAAANAAAYGYPAESSSAAYAVESSAAPEYPAYPAESSAAYAASTPAAEYPAYPAKSTPAAYPVSSAVEYPVEYSSAPAYTTTKVVTGLTTVCPEPTTLTYGSKTYTVSKSTTLVDDDCEYTTTYEVKPTPSAVKTPVHSEYAPPKYTPAGSSPAPYPTHPAGNGTVPAGTASPSAGKPSSTKPSTPEFTGAAGKATVGFLAIAAAVAAFL